MNIVNEITRFSKSQPTKIAAKGPDFLVTYEELEKNINKTANFFKTIGVREGQRILIQIGNRIEFLYCYYAAMKINAIIVPINPTYTPSEMSFIVDDSQPSLYISEQQAKGNIETVINHSNHLLNVLLIDEEDEEMDFMTQVINESSVFKDFDGDDYSVCQILYTSGTTGQPKGAMLTHDGLAGNAKSYSKILKCNEDDISLIVAPLFHAASQTNCLNTMIMSGASNYILPGFKTELVLQTFESEQITYFFGPPTMYAILLNNENIESYKLNLRIAFTGAAAMPVQVHERWKVIFGFDILEGYGLSECSPVVSNHRAGEPIKHGSIGRVLPGVTVKIVDENDLEVAIGEIGEVAVKGPNIMKGYWNRPEETKRVIRDDWFYTGDIGREDEDGYLYIIDRQKDMIIQGGMKIYPREIEEVIYQYDCFLEVAVVGEPDPVMGEIVVAHVTLKNQNDKKRLENFEEVQKYCATKLAPYKIPKKFYILDEMPKTLTGKIRKVELAK